MIDGLKSDEKNLVLLLPSTDLGVLSPIGCSPLSSNTGGQEEAYIVNFLEEKTSHPSYSCFAICILHLKQTKKILLLASKYVTISSNRNYNTYLSIRLS